MKMKNFLFQKMHLKMSLQYNDTNDDTDYDYQETSDGIVHFATGFHSSI